MHPDFPSIASISDALTQWNVENIVTKLDLYKVTEIPLPALAFMNTRGGSFVILTSVAEGSVKWLDCSDGWHEESFAHFADSWSGVTLLLEPDDNSGEPNYQSQLKLDRLQNMKAVFLRLGIIFCGLLGLRLSYSNLSLFPETSFIYLATRLTGGLVCCALLASELGKQSGLTTRICQLTSRNGCRNILISKASKITSWLSWSDIGLIYFLGGGLGMALSFLIGTYFVWEYIAWLSILPTPFIVYSLWYQRFVAREWCLLCVLIQLILLIDFSVLLLYMGQISITIQTEAVLLTIFSFCIVSTLWVYAKPILRRSLRFDDLTRELQQTKFNEHYLQAIFDASPNMPPFFEDMDPVTLGDPTAENTLTIITNPICQPCANIFFEIEQLLDTSINFKCQFIFVGPHKAFLIGSSFMDCTDHDRRHLMRSWFSDVNQDVDKWRKSIATKEPSVRAVKEFELYSNWMEMAEVTQTPTIFMNDRKVPNEFRVSDLRRIRMLMDLPQI